MPLVNSAARAANQPTALQRGWKREMRTWPPAKETVFLTQLTKGTAKDLEWEKE